MVLSGCGQVIAHCCVLYAHACVSTHVHGYMVVYIAPTYRAAEKSACEKITMFDQTLSPRVRVWLARLRLCIIYTVSVFDKFGKCIVQAENALA